MTYEPKLHVLLSCDEIAAGVSRLAAEISRDYHAKRPVLIGVLKGSFIFLADLVRQMDLPLEVDFVAISSYGAGTESCGQVNMLQSPCLNLCGRHVLIVEDIIDTGLTTNFLLRYIHEQKAASVKLCALTDKSLRRKVPVTIDYLGFSVPDKFIVGYGIDCNEEFRNLPDIRYMKEEK